MSSLAWKQTVARTIGGGVFAVVLAIAGIAPASAALCVSFSKTPDTTADPGGIVNVGDTVTFTYTITNPTVSTGGCTVSDAVTPQMIDFLPGMGNVDWTTVTGDDGDCSGVGGSFPGQQDLHCDLRTIAVGETKVITVSGIVQSCAVLTSTASLEVEVGTPHPVLTDPGTIIVPCPATFVIGDIEPHDIGDTVNFWGSQWWKNNVMSGFVANGVSSFKGYASSSDNECGGKWGSRVGNTAPPPPEIGDVIQVIVTDTVTKKGPNIGGNIVQILNVQVGGDYGPSPGHKDFGTVLSVVCPVDQ